MGDKVTLEFALVVDADGDFTIGKDLDEAREAYGEEFSAGQPLTHYQIALTVPVPAPIEVSGELPEGSGSLALEVKPA